MTTQEQFLKYPENQRVAYLVALTAIATADHENSDEEIAFIEQVCAAAQVSQNGADEVKAAMQNPQSINMPSYWAVLRTSDLKFSLIADIMNMVYADGELDKEEVEQIKKMSAAVGISEEQIGVLGEYVTTANKNAEAQEGNPGMMGFLNNPSTLAMAGSFLSQSGLLNKFSGAGIPTENFNSGSTFATALTGMAANFMQGKASAGGQNAGMQDMAGGLLGSLMGGGNSGGGFSAGGQGIGGMLSGALQSQAGQNAVNGLLSQVMGSTQKGSGLGNLASLIGGGQNKPGQNNGGIGGLLKMFF